MIRSRICMESGRTSTAQSISVVKCIYFTTLFRVRLVLIFDYCNLGILINSYKMFRLSSLSLSLRPLITRTVYCNSNTEQVSPGKTYRMPIKPKPKIYTPSTPLMLHNGRVLLYLNKQSLVTPYLISLHITAPFVLLLYLLPNNPWYLVFPASLPLMLLSQIILMARWVFHKKHYKYIVERIYFNIGNIVEFHFSNKIRRALKSTQESHFFEKPEELMTPPFNSIENYSQRGMLFPQTFDPQDPLASIQKGISKPMLSYGWTKYAENYQHYVIPAKYEYINWELLMPLFQGYEIETFESQDSFCKLPEGEDYLSPEQEIKMAIDDWSLHKPGLVEIKGKKEFVKANLTLSEYMQKHRATEQKISEDQAFLLKNKEEYELQILAHQASLYKSIRSIKLKASEQAIEKEKKKSKKDGK